MKFFHFLFFILIASIISITFSCKSDPLDDLLPMPEMEQNCDTCTMNNPLSNAFDQFNLVINDSMKAIFNGELKQLPNYSPPPMQPDSESSIEEEREGAYVCTVQHIKLGAEYNEQFMADGRSDVLYEGNLINGNSLADGANQPIPCEKDTLTLSISLTTEEGLSPKIIVANPTLSNVREAKSELLHRVAENATPANVSFEIEEVRAEEEVNVHTGGSFSGWGVKVKGKYDFNNKETKTRYLIKFIQKYYTIDLDEFSKPSDYFSQLPDIESFGTYSPVYISSVTYGRMIFFSYESNYSQEDSEKAISVAFNKFGKGGDVELSHKDKQILEESKIKGVILGGPSGEVDQIVTGIEGLKSILKSGNQFSIESPGVPIAYNMRFLNTGEVAKLVFNTEFPIRNCELYTEEMSFHPNDGQEYYRCAEYQSFGDREFNGKGPKVDGTIQLVNEGKDIFAEVNCTWKEVGGDGSAGKVEEKIHLWTLPEDKVFAGFADNARVHFSYTDTSFDLDYPEVSGSDFINWLQVKGDTAGVDLNCKGEDDSNMRFKFNPITIKVRPLNP